MASAAPSVSVILPTYNRAHLLPRAIASVLGQSFRDLELIIIDDGSTDGTEQVVRGLGDPRVVYLPPEKNLGDAGARNRGAAAARGEWLAFQDSDDEWFAGKLELQVAYARQLGPEFAAVGSTLVRFIGGPVEQLAWPVAGGGDLGEVDRRAFLLNGYAYLQTLLVRRAAFEQLGGFDTRVKSRSDFEFCVRLVHGFRVAAQSVPTVISYETPDSISLRLDYRRADVAYVLQKHASTIEADRRVAGRYWYDLAKVLALQGERGPAMTAAMRSLRRKPLAPLTWVLLLLAPFGASAVQRSSVWTQKLRGVRP